MTTELTEDEWREATGYELIDWRRVFRVEGERDAAWDRFLDRVRQAAKAEALREAAGSIDLDKIADEWSQGPGNRDDMRWAAGNAASTVQIAILNAADRIEKETPDEQ